MLVALLAVASVGYAQPFGYAINSDSSDLSDELLDSLYLINLADGTSEFIGNVNFLDVEGLAFDEAGTLFGVDENTNTLITIDTVTGAGISATGINGNLALSTTTFFDFGLTFSCLTTQPLLSSDNEQMLFRVELEENARATSIGTTTVNGSNNVSITGLATRFVDGVETIYGLGAGEVSPNLYTINSETGAATLVGPLTGADSYSDGGIAFDENGQLWAITDRTLSGGSKPESQILLIDIETGSATAIANTLTGIETLAITALDCLGSVVGPGDDIPQVPTLNVFGLLSLFSLLLIFTLGRQQKLRS